LAGVIVAGRYRVERLIGQGGMGSVWAGRHLSLDQVVAIKFVHPKLIGSQEALRRFDVEARAAARIQSRHAVSVMDHGVTEANQPYIVMEYLEGESMQDKVGRLGSLPLKEVVEIVDQASRALGAAHGAGIIHRDLKPENIFLAKDPDAPDGYVVKVVDFGIAKMVHDQAAHGAATTQAGTVLGTPHFMSPETLVGSADVTPLSDIWSLGACAFEALCGRTPFDGEAIGDVVLKVCSQPLPVPSRVKSSVPTTFDAWFFKACHREPPKRFSSVAEMANALKRLDEWSEAEKETSAYEIRPRQQSQLELELAEYEPPSRGRFLAGLLGGIAIAVGALGYFVLQRTQTANEAAARAAAAAMAAQMGQQARPSASASDAGVDARADAPDADAAKPR
jgi:serine/threonine-protein kinase